MTVSTAFSGSAAFATEKSKPVSKISVHDHWSAEALQNWSAAGVIQGYMDGSLRPDQPVTRAEYAAIVNRIFGIKGDPNRLAEIPENAWYAQHLSAAIQSGYLPGADQLQPYAGGRLTRVEAARSLAVLFGFTREAAVQKTPETQEAQEQVKYKDIEALDLQSRQAIQALSAASYIYGYEDGTFQPERPVTRGELMSILDRLVSTFIYQKGEATLGQLQGNVVINQPGARIKDGKVSGNIYFAEGIGEGDSRMDQVDVQNTVYVQGGGENNIVIHDSNVQQLDIDRRDGKVRVLISGATHVEGVRINRHARLEQAGNDGTTIGLVELAPGAGQVELLGSYPQVEVVPGTGSQNGLGADTAAVPTLSLTGNVQTLRLKRAAHIILNKGAVIDKLIVVQGVGASSVTGVGSIGELDNEADGFTVNGKALSRGKHAQVKLGEASSTVTAPLGPSSGTSSGGSGNSGGSGDGNGGGEIPVPLWTLVWNDEFEGTSIDRSKWTFDLTNGESVGNPGWGNRELQYYTDRPENVRVEDGKLVITAIKEPNKYQGYDYTSTRIKTKGLFSKKYGKFEIRAKLPGGKGLWPAIWMLPEHDVYGTWAASGEIDIMEGWGSDTGRVGGTLHYGGQWPDNTYSGKEYYFNDGSTTEDYHVYGLEWEPGELRWYVDGELYSTQNDWFSKSKGQPINNAYPAPFDEQFHLIMNLAVGGNFDGNPEADTVFPADMHIDYVRVYELTGREYRQPVPPAFPQEDYPAGSIAPLEDGNLMRNGDFTKHNEQPGIPQIASVPYTDYWNLFTGEGGDGELALEQIGSGKYAKVSIRSGGNQPYSVQPLGIVSLAKGRYYKLSFDAKSDAARSMNVKLTGGADRGFTAYSQALQADLDQEMKRYEMTFQMKQDSDAAARIEFNLGLSTHPVWFGNVRLEEVSGLEFDHDAAKIPLGDGNHIYNGTFDQGEADRLTYWHVLKSDGASAVASVDPAERKFNLAVAQGGSGLHSIQLVQRGLQLIQGLEYELSFDGKVAANRPIEVELMSKDGISYGRQQLTLDPETRRLTAGFKMEGASDEAAQIVFHLGGAAGTVQLDNIRLVRTSEYFEPGTVFYPLVNGDFSQGLSPWQLVNPEGGGASQAAVENGQAKLQITNSGSMPHSVLFFQDGLSVSKGLAYALEFDASSTVERKMKVTVENSSYTAHFAQTIDLSPETNRYTYEFRIPENEIAALKFLLGDVGNGVIGTPHDVILDNVVLKVKNAPVLPAPGLFADTTNRQVGQEIEISFQDDSEWRSAVTAMKINGATVSDYRLEPGKLLLPAHLFPAGGNYEIVVQAEGYADAIVKQTMLESDGNLITNGSFQEGTAGWNTWFGDGGVFEFSAEGGEAVLAISGLGPNNWSNQWFQNDIPVMAGKTYELSFAARSTVNRDMIVEFTGTSAGQAKFNVTGDSQVFTHRFTVDSDHPLKLNYLIGKGTTDFTAPHTLYIDDIVIREIEDGEAALVTAPEPEEHSLLNRDFSAGTDSWDLHSSDESDAAISADQGELGVEFVPGESFTPQEIVIDDVILTEK